MRGATTILAVLVTLMDLVAMQQTFWSAFCPDIQNEQFKLLKDKEPYFRIRPENLSKIIKVY